MNNFSDIDRELKAIRKVMLALCEIEDPERRAWALGMAAEQLGHRDFARRIAASIAKRDLNDAKPMTEA